MIRVEQLTKRYGSVVALNGLSFQAEDGKITGLLGPNGAGKTTSLRILSSLVKADSGQVFIDDLEVSAEPRRALARIGILPDSRGLYPRLTARENVRYYGELRGLRGEQLEARIEQLVEVLEMQAEIDRRVEGFSRGQRTKVAIARVLVHEPQTIVFDEPTNGLDVMSTRAMRGLLRGLADQGKCVVFSSHVMQEVSALCDHIVVMRAGRVAQEGSGESLLATTGSDQLEEAFMKIIGSGEGLA